MGFVPSSMQLTSGAFDQGTHIPARYTGEGDNVSPPLAWEDAPEDAKSFAIICHDPDAPLITPAGAYGFVHWVLYNIPGDVRHLEEATHLYTNGNSDYGKPGYGGPMPPNGHGPHYYYFWLMALNEETNLEPGLGLTELLQRIEPNVIAANRLVGTYERK